jgi:hypothetical protein
VTLALPPEDPLELTDAFPARQLPVSYRYSRIHRYDKGSEWFCDCRDCRFDPPQGAAFGTCYLAAHPLGAFIEKFGRLRARRASFAG